MRIILILFVISFSLNASQTKVSINKYVHLPGIPSAEEVKDNGINISDMQAKMLEKNRRTNLAHDRT